MNFIHFKEAETMTNTAIIQENCILYGIFETVHTYAGWQARGMQVKKGSKALFKTAIWKHKAAKTNKDGPEKPAKMFLVKGLGFIT